MKIVRARGGRRYAFRMITTGQVQPAVELTVEQGWGMVLLTFVLKVPEGGVALRFTPVTTGAFRFACRSRPL